MLPTHPVFYDAKKKRWPVFLSVLTISITLLILIFLGFGIALLANPINHQVLNISGQVNHLIGVNKTEKIYKDTQRKLKSIVKLSKKNQPVNNSNNQNQVFGFLVNWDDTSFTSLKHNIDKIDDVFAEWLHLADSNGEIKLDDAPKQQHMLKVIRQTKPSLKVIAMINNFSSSDGWQTDLLSGILNTKFIRDQLINNLVVYSQNENLDGINIDFEEIPTNQMGNYMTFLSDLTSKLHAIQKQIYVDVPLDNSEFEYSKIAQIVDGVVVMAYDEHWATSSSGPIASIGWFSKLITKRQKDIPLNKLIVSIGNYGYDWLANQPESQTVSYQEAIVLARDSESSVNLDPVSLNSNFEYYDDQNKLHQIWFLDAISAYNQMSLLPSNIGGVALWRLGSEDPTIWNFINLSFNKLDQNIISKLSNITYGYDVDYEGSGEILKIISTPQVGSRQIAYDSKTNLITGQKYLKYPSSYVIERYGGNNSQKIALTFDDGPDPKYTGHILDILKKYNVKATFFITGANADKNSDLLKRMVAEGHDIGNHTFTHPNITMISKDQLSLELNATQRLLESRLGRSTLLFRPPYAEDIEPATPNQVKPLMTVSEMGYYTVGIHIDPNDWRNPGVDNIVNSVINGVDNKLGSVVLLHDSGGQRQQTLAALPIIIEKLQAQKYQLVSVSNLLGKTRDEIMPLVTTSTNENMEPYIFGFNAIDFLTFFSFGLFFTAIFISIARLFIIIILALVEEKRLGKIIFDPDYNPKVSIIIPSYNEEKVIIKTVELLFGSIYKNIEIIVVDDGSSDNTWKLLLKKYGLHHRLVKLVCQKNGGKPSAINNGISQSSGQIAIILDADTLFDKFTVANLVRHFNNPEIVAVAGNAKVGNRLNFLTKIQALEYITSQNLDRRAFDLLNCITVVPGAVGAWRIKEVLSLGGFADHTLAEDADLTISLLEKGFKIVYEPEAYAFTESPDNLKSFIKQRFRWMYGTAQAFWKHRASLFNTRQPTLGLVALPNILIFQIFYPLISPITDLTMIVVFVFTLFNWAYHPSDYIWANLINFGIYYGLFLIVDLLAAIIAFKLEKKENYRLIAYMFIQRIFYRQLIFYVAIKSVLTAIKGSAVGWNKFERKATVVIKE